MDAVRFERILSFRPEYNSLCLRDFIFDYYCKTFQDTALAHQATKEYTDKLYAQFVGVQS